MKEERRKAIYKTVDHILKLNPELLDSGADAICDQVEAAMSDRLTPAERDAVEKGLLILLDERRKNREIEYFFLSLAEKEAREKREALHRKAAAERRKKEEERERKAARQRKAAVERREKDASKEKLSHRGGSR